MADLEIYVKGIATKQVQSANACLLYTSGAVFPCPTPRLFDTVLNEVVVSALRLDNVKIVFAPAGVNIGIAGVLVFLPFVMSFQRSCRIALVLLKSQNCVLCHSAPFPIPFLSGTFPQENPAGNISDRIGME